MTDAGGLRAAMNSNTRKLLENLRFSVEVIDKAEEVLRVWKVEELFDKCSYCGNVCFNPDLPRGKHLRKKLPADLFLRRELVSLRDEVGDVICLPCDEYQFEYG